MNKQELEDKMQAGMKGHPWNCEAKGGHIDLGGKVCPKCRAAIPQLFGPLEYQNFFGPQTPAEVPDPELDLKQDSEAIRVKYESKMVEMQSALLEVEAARSVGNERARRAAFDHAEELRTDGRRMLLSMNYVGTKILARRLGLSEPARPGWIDRISAPYD